MSLKSTTSLTDGIGTAVLASLEMEQRRPRQSSVCESKTATSSRAERTVSSVSGRAETIFAAACVHNPPAAAIFPFKLTFRPFQNSSSLASPPPRSCASRSPSTGGKLNGFITNLRLLTQNALSSPRPPPWPLSVATGSLSTRTKPCGFSSSFPTFLPSPPVSRE